MSHGEDKLIVVKCISVMERNNFFWRDGRIEINEYPEEDILCLITESLRTSKMYTPLKKGHWNKIETL